MTAIVDTQTHALPLAGALDPERTVAPHDARLSLVVLACVQPTSIHLVTTFGLARR
jgi:hypothetical protein